MIKYLFLLSSVLLFQFCSESVIGKSSNSTEKQIPKNIQSAFKKYWHAGKAELTSYYLKQARYGEIHKGHTLLVFVTENFNSQDQVKEESGWNKNTITVFKLNRQDRFITGVYDYSMMTSVFVAEKFSSWPNALKVTSTSQDWCGHTFTQLNLNDDSYKVQSFSYFGSEKDQNREIQKVFLEDELLARIRQWPGLLPTGNIKLVQRNGVLRLRHQKPIAVKAKAQVIKYRGNEFRGNNLYEYKIVFENQRNVSYIFENTPPFQIAGWQDTYKSGWGKSAKVLTSIAHKKSQLLSAYWAKHKNIDEHLRKKLKL